MYLHVTMIFDATKIEETVNLFIYYQVMLIGLLSDVVECKV